MKRFWIVTLLSIIPMFTTGPGVTAQGDLSRTVIEVYEWREYVPQPIRIVGLKYGGNEVENGEPFQAPAIWIRDLSVSVKNVSDQTLRYIEVVVEFPRDEQENPTLAQVSLWKGFPYIQSAELPTSLEFSLAPGEEADLFVSKSSYEAFQSNVENLASPDSVLHSAKVKTEAAAFTPDRIWMRGAYLNRDPKNRTRWIVDQDEQDKMRRRVPKLGLSLKRVGFNPGALSIAHVQGGCYYWDDAQVLNCTGAGCAGCTVTQDKSHPVTQGWRKICITAQCRKVVGGQLVDCPGCTKSVFNINFNNLCDSGSPSGG